MNDKQQFCIMCGAVGPVSDGLCETCDMQIFWSAVGRVNYRDTLMEQQRADISKLDEADYKIVTCPDCDVKYIDRPAGRACPTCSGNRKRRNRWY